MATPSMLGNLFKLLLFITMWNPLALVQHSQFLTCCLSPGLCLIHKPSQKDTLTNMSAYSLRSPQLQDLQSKDHALQLPVLQAQVSGDKSQFQNPGLQVSGRQFQPPIGHLHSDVLQKPQTQMLKMNSHSTSMHKLYPPPLFPTLGLPPTSNQPPIPVNFPRKLCLISPLNFLSPVPFRSLSCYRK